jgi:hypothetical protein
MKLYSDWKKPGLWIAYVPGEGWVAFPAAENGWENRRPARGLDPVHLRQVPVDRAAAAGIPVEEPELTYR